MTELHPTPPPKMPEHLSTDKPARATEEKKIDRQMEDSFPASDPPSFSGGNHTIGAPVERESGAATGETHEVKAGGAEGQGRNRQAARQH